MTAVIALVTISVIVSASFILTASPVVNKNKLQTANLTLTELNTISDTDILPSTSTLLPKADGSIINANEIYVVGYSFLSEKYPTLQVDIKPVTITFIGDIPDGEGALYVTLKCWTGSTWSSALTFGTGIYTNGYTSFTVNIPISMPNGVGNVYFQIQYSELGATYSGTDVTLSVGATQIVP